MATYLYDMRQTRFVVRPRGIHVSFNVSSETEPEKLRLARPALGTWEFSPKASSAGIPQFLGDLDWQEASPD